MKIKEGIQYILSLLTLVLLVVFVVWRAPNSNLRYQVYLPYIRYIAAGFLWTILISLIVFILSFLLGGIMFLGNKSRSAYIRYMISHITMFMFGSPQLVVVIVFYFFIGNSFGISNKLFLGIITLTLYYGPFMMKLYIGAFESIDQNQFLVCDIFGFKKWQMYYYVILPQMLRIMMPPLSANLATIIKSSSLLYLIGFSELYYSLTNVQSTTFAYTEGYILMIILYLMITIPILKLAAYLEKRIKL